MRSTRVKPPYRKKNYRYAIGLDAEACAKHQALIIARAPQSVNDMKSKGENRRFMDETGYLLDGIEDESATKGFRRAR